MATTYNRQNQSSSQQFRSQQVSARQPHDDGNPTRQGRQGHQGPVESFRLNNISISIFENESEREGNRSVYHRAKIDKRYLDQKSGEWKSSTSFSVDELLRLQHLISTTVDFMAQKPGDHGA